MRKEMKTKEGLDRHLSIIIICMAMVTGMVSCGRKYQAETLVEVFVEEHALSPSELEDRDYVHFDSTKVISDSLIIALQGRRHELFKHPIPYPTSSSGRMLYLLRMSYVHKGDTLFQTFYLDEQLEHVVAFK